MGRRGNGQAATPVGACQSDGRHAGNRQRGDEPRVHRPRQDRNDDVERRLIGDAQAVHMPLLDAGRFERRIDLASPAVDNQQERVGCKRRPRRDARDRSDDPTSRTNGAAG